MSVSGVSFVCCCWKRVEASVSPNLQHMVSHMLGYVLTFVVFLFPEELVSGVLEVKVDRSWRKFGYVEGCCIRGELIYGGHAFICR